MKQPSLSEPIAIILVIALVTLAGLAAVFGAVDGVHGDCPPWFSTRESLLLPTMPVGCWVGHWFTHQ